MSEHVRCCIDYPVGAGMPSWATALEQKLWPNGHRLRVRFLGGDDAARAIVERYAPLWSEHANITLLFDGHPDAEIRISFVGGGSWSTVGVDCLDVPPEEPTMNYGWLRPGLSPEEARGVVLHEFGHALGLIHEHQSPAGGIPWNREAIYKKLSGSPNFWDRKTIDHNMFETYAKDQTRYTNVDRHSIMMYPIDSSWVTDPRYAVDFNSGLSELDRSFIAQIYPRH